jgi:hypothetical protein
MGGSTVAEKGSGGIWKRLRDRFSK